MIKPKITSTMKKFGLATLFFLISGGLLAACSLKNGGSTPSSDSADFVTKDKLLHDVMKSAGLNVQLALHSRLDEGVMVKIEDDQTFSVGSKTVLIGPFSDTQASDTQALKNEENALYQRSVVADLSSEEEAFLAQQAALQAKKEANKALIDQQFASLRVGDMVSESTHPKVVALIKEQQEENGVRILVGSTQQWRIERSAVFVGTYKVLAIEPAAPPVEEEKPVLEAKKAQLIPNLVENEKEDKEFSPPSYSYAYYKMRLGAVETLLKNDLERETFKEEAGFALKNQFQAVQDRLSQEGELEIVYIGSYHGSVLMKELGLSRLSIVSLHDSKTHGQEVNKEAMKSYIAQTNPSVILADNTVSNRLVEELVFGRRVEFLNVSTENQGEDAFVLQYLNNLLAIERSVIKK